MHNPLQAFLSLGSVVLSITGRKHCMQTWDISAASRSAEPVRLPMVILATLATVIGSQGVISGPIP